MMPTASARSECIVIPATICIDSQAPHEYEYLSRFLEDIQDPDIDVMILSKGRAEYIARLRDRQWGVFAEAKDHPNSMLARGIYGRAVSIQQAIIKLVEQIRGRAVVFNAWGENGEHLRKSYQAP